MVVAMRIVAVGSRKLVDANGVSVEIRLKGGPGVVGTQPTQPVGQPIIVDVRGDNGFAQQRTEDPLVLCDPGFDVVETGIGVGQDKEKPDGQNVRRCERPLPVEGSGKVPLQVGQQVEPLDVCPQDGQVRDAFGTGQAGLGGAHVPIYPNPLLSVSPKLKLPQNTSEP
ncbi:hypothetical protein [Fimbriiglobus ruber]|nr:hypothetical protein [Fimbriiglobus ruber]